MLFLGRLLAASAMLCLCLQCACSKKSKAPVAVIAPVRVVLLPFGVPADNKDLQWEAMAAPILLAKASELAPDLVVVPLWEAMPTAIQSAGASRIFTQESAASVATWLSAKWSILGDISATKTGITTIVDFIPAKNNQIAFRYMKARRTDFLGSDSREAIMQFLRYLVARPLESAKGNLPNMTSVKTLAEALNREYGWLVDADPGKAQEVVANLARSDDRLARLLFNPSLYPALAQAK
jgi:hypothetical protein